VGIFVFLIRRMIGKIISCPNLGLGKLGIFDVLNWSLGS